jgi:hypothetical protein
MLLTIQGDLNQEFAVTPFIVFIRKLAAAGFCVSGCANDMPIL